MKTIFKAGRLVNEYRTLDLSEKAKSEFDLEFKTARENFKNLKLSMEQDTKKEIDDLLKSIKEMNEEAGLEIEVEAMEKRISEDKIRIPRWMTKTVAEFVEDKWEIHEINMKNHFFPFSRISYLPNSDFLVIGGLNQIVEDKPHFTDQVLKISEVVVSPFEHFYSANEIVNLNRPRGCFASVYEDGWVYVFGGFNYFDKEMRYCERFDTKNGNKWEELPKMTYPRKNPCACSVGNKIYVFGGGNVK